MKRFANKDPAQLQRKRKKPKLSIEEPVVTERVKGETLRIQTLREGMLLLGCVVEVHPDHLVMSLPGCLVGKVPVTNISRKFLEVIKGSDEDDDETIETNLSKLIQLGCTLPCKVLQIDDFELKKNATIHLSINPCDVNTELRPGSLYPNMVLHSAIQSREDHGYIVDVGVKGVQGFLPFDAAKSDSLHVGQVLPMSVQKLPTKKNGNVVWLSELSFDDEYPEVEDKDLKFESILPGANIVSYITRVTNLYIYMKYMEFNACTAVSSLGKTNNQITEGAKVRGRVLYTDPISNLMYLQLTKKPTPGNFDKLFKMKKYDVLRNAKYINALYSRVMCRIHGRAFGFVKKRNLEQNSISLKSLEKDTNIGKPRVLCLHYMDNLVQLSFNKKFIEKKLVRLEDIKVGQTYECSVRKHLKEGMVVRVSFDLCGYVPYTHMADSVVTHPDQLHPVKSKVKCRVLSLEMESYVTMTCKRSLLKLPPDGMLMSLDQAKAGEMYKGVLVQKTDNYYLVRFFNGVKGIVQSSEVPAASVYYVGQTVSCHVIRKIPEKQKMYLTLKGPRFGGVPDDVANSQVPRYLNEQKKLDELMESAKMDPKIKRPALIANITGHQLNLVLQDSVKGRVHVTELGTKEEDKMPLSKYKGGQKVTVHCFDFVTKRSWNFLEISHQKYAVTQECAFEHPPPCPPDRDLREGDTVLAFIKKKLEDRVEIWLTPRRVGFLHYLNICQDPKALRKMKNKLKVGMSVKVKVLEVGRRDGDVSDVQLTKLDENPIKAGVNVAGLVRRAHPSQGLLLQLAHGYRGEVGLTDLADRLATPIPELDKCLKIGYVRCHVLEVDHDKKFCQLSMRRSRLYGTVSPDTDPEVTLEGLAEGATVKGIVVLVLRHALIVNLGRSLDGRLSRHDPACKARDCAPCRRLDGHQVGDVVAAHVTSVASGNAATPVQLEFLTQGAGNEEMQDSSEMAPEEQEKMETVEEEATFKTVSVQLSLSEQEKENTEASPKRLHLAEDIDWGKL